MAHVACKAFARDFVSDAAEQKVLYVIATLAKPDSGWILHLVPQEGHPDQWRLLETRPDFGDKVPTAYIASGCSEREIDVPDKVTVFTPEGEIEVPVEPW